MTKLNKKVIKIVSFLFILFSIFSNTYAHSGGLDSLGGHNVRTEGKGYEVGTYHYHKGQYAGWIVDNKGDIPTGNDIFDPKLITDSINISSASSWSHNELENAYKSGLFKNLKSTFEPKFKASINREEFCKLVVNYVELKYPNYKAKFIRSNNTFSDLNKYKNEINIAYKLGIINGYSSDYFKPNKDITREEIACMIYRCLDIFDNLNSNKTANIKDASAISSWAIKEVNTLVNLNIIKGISSDSNGIVFSPKANTSIEQAVVLIYRIY